MSFWLCRIPPAAVQDASMSAADRALMQEIVFAVQVLIVLTCVAVILRIWTGPPRR